MKKSSFFLYIVILITASVLRLYRIGDIPPGVNRDEASIGYTAFSLLKTGKDEYGRLFPVSFQSFGDWKLPLYIYVTIPSVAIFGLSEFSVRLPSVLAGLATVGLTFFLAKKLFDNDRIALLSMFLLAITPWHIHFSRVASEANLATFFSCVGLFLFLKGLKRPPWLIASFIFFALTYYTYHGNHVFTTLLIPGVIIIYRKSFTNIKYVVVALSLFCILTLYILSQTLVGADRTKISGISIFGDPSVVYTKIETPRNQFSNPNGIIPRLLYNRATYTITTITRNYIASYSPYFLFFHGGTNHAHNIENSGNLYPVEAIFLIFGIAILYGYKGKETSKLLFWWFLIAPVAASITKDAPHSARMFSFLPLPSLVAGLGLYTIIQVLKKYPIFQKLCISGLILGYIFNIAVYLNNYYVNFPVNEVQYWGIGYKKLTALVMSERYKAKQVIIERPEYSPYIFILFYSKYNPAAYQKKAILYPATPDGFYHVKHFDRFEFHSIDWSQDPKVTNALFFGFPDTIPDAQRVNVKEIEKNFLYFKE